MDNWTEFCDIANRKHSTEYDYEQALGMGFRYVFGWVVEHQRNINIGSRNSLKPDIILKKQGLDKIVVEVKRRDASPGNEAYSQIGSYLRQLNVRFGLVAADKLQLVYNGADTQNPIKLLDIPFEPSDKNGARLAELIICDTFDPDALNQFCEELLRRLNIEKESRSVLGELVGKGGKKIICEALKNSALTERYNAHAIELAVDELVISKKAVAQPAAPISNSTRSKSQRNTKAQKIQNNIHEAPAERFREYYDLTQELLRRGRQDEFSPIRRLNEVDPYSSCKYVKLNDTYAVRTNHSKVNLESDLRKLKSLLSR
jgi:hypothetical protein